LAAATTAARKGVTVSVLDEYPKPGGQYLKGGSARAAPASATEKRGRKLLKELAGLNVNLRTATLVWGVEQQEGSSAFNLALQGPTGPDWLETQSLIVATGARELVVPFPGWTLPGVTTLGAAHLLTKEHDTLPGRRVLVAGSGVLVFPVVHQLLRLGAQVIGVFEASHLRDWPRHTPALWGHGDRLREGLTYLTELARARVPYRPGRAVAKALGNDRLEGVEVVRLARNGAPIPDSAQGLTVDALCVGYGFVPNIDVTQLLGCEHRFDASRGGWVPVVSQRLETTVPGAYAAGEVVGVDGAGAAMLEGHIAGLAAAEQLGYLDGDDVEQELHALQNQRRRYRRFGAVLNSLFAPRPGLDQLTTPDTMVCRCEEVTLAEVAASVHQGTRELDDLKTATRVGQGFCQGRTCGPHLARYVARETGRISAQVGMFHVRPPLKPVPAGYLAQGEER
jgi:thioredoxin reductase